MSAVPAEKARRIGEIVIELGFASEADLAKANIEQEKTGQPLGQVLVDLGLITRLELASALAEQWSDQSASIKLLPIPPRARRPPESHDDDQYAARLQDAVAELAQRVGAGAAAPSDELDVRVTDLAERIEATVARTQRIEATLATLAESFEGVTGGVEEAFGALQSGMAGLALDLARIDTTVAEMVATPTEASGPDPALTARLEELGAAVAALADRAVADPETDGRLDALATRVEGIAETAETPDAALTARIEEVVATVAALTERPVADPAAIESRLDVLAARVESLGETDEADELRASLAAMEERVAALAERPVADPAEVEGRLDALAARVENIVTPDEVVALHESLVAFEQRLAVLAEDAGSTAALDEQARSLEEQTRSLEQQALSLAELRATVVELESRPVGDPELDERLARIETQFAEQLAAKPDAGEVQSLATRLEASVAEHEGLATAVAQIGVRLDEMTWRDDGSATRLEELQAQVQALGTTLTEVRQSLAAQEDAGAPQRLDELGQSLAAVRDEISALAQTVTPADRIEQIAHRVDDLTAEREAQQALGARLEEIEARLTADVVTPEHLARALADAREDLTPAPAPLPDPRVDELTRELASLRDDQAPDPRIDRLADDLSEVRAQLAEVSTTAEPVHDPAVQEQLEALAARIEQLAGDRESETALAAKLDDLERRLPTETVTPDELTNALERTREELTSAAAASLASDPRVDELSSGLASLRAELAGVRDAPAPAPDDSAVRDEIAALARRIEEIPAAEPRDDAPLVAKIEALEQRLEAPVEADPRIDALAQDIAAVREQLATAALGSADFDPQLLEKLEALEQRVEAPATADPVVEQLTQQLTHDLDAVREQVAKLERTPVTDPVVASELDTLSQRLRFLDVRVNEEVPTTGEMTQAIDALRAELASVGTPVAVDTSELEGTIQSLSTRLDGLAESIATGAAGSAGPAAEELQRLVDERIEARVAEQVAERVAELTRGLEERFAAAESQPRAAGSVTGDTTGLEDLLERNRMTIERLGLHLGEHDRALAELMRSRNLPKKLDELAARIDEIAGGAPAGGAKPAPGTRREIGTFSSSEPSTGEVKALMRRVEDAEIASQADREKLMNRLERMASSIDWRLQRLGNRRDD